MNWLLHLTVVGAAFFSVASVQAQPVVDPVAVNPAVVRGGFESRYGTQLFRGRLISQLGDLPVTVGIGGVISDDSKQFDVGVLAGLGPNATLSLVFRTSQDSALRALGVVSTETLTTYAGSAHADFLLPGSNGALALTGYAEFWTAPGGAILHSDLLSTATFNGAGGFRLAPGFRLTLAGDVSLSGALGWEQATLNGENGIFAELRAAKRFDGFDIGVMGWTSPNFGTGAKLSLDYVFDSGTRIGAFAGYEWSGQERVIVGLSLAVPFGGAAGGGTTPGTNALGAHMDHVNDTLPGMPITARRKAIMVEAHQQAPQVPWPFATVYGHVCATNQATPGCTFSATNGARITVTSDPDYNTLGGGSNDLWYVKFDGVGNAAVFNEFGQFQYMASVSDFAGYVGGNTVGVGTTGVYWENVANGTYWLGKNGVLYNANFGETKYGQAVN